MAEAKPPAKTTTRVVVRTKTITRRYKATSEAKKGTKDEDLDWFMFMLSLIALFLFTCLVTALHIATLTHDRYIRPYLTEVIAWKPEHTDNLYTFDFLPCESVTAKTAEEITVLPNFTRVDVFDHLLTHGAGIFGKLADDDLMQRVRSYVLWRNQRISVSENIPVIETENRYSFGLDVNEVPILSEFLHQITTRNPLLETALEGLLGPNPAVVELSTITALEGAQPQRWHHDMDYVHSAPVLGRSFQHMYSLLIPLQDTTVDMGSTGVAPGSHYCANTNFMDSFAVAKDGVWKAGDGLLYHSGLVHRGGGHSSGPARVAVILTFTNRPDASHISDLSTTYSRLLSRGAVYALRYNHWGFAWNDLKSSNDSMAVPYVRSFGIYKQPDQQWGWTYFRSTCFRMMHDQGGFMAMDLKAFVRARLGIFKYIPKFLHGPVVDLGDNDDYAPWPRFLSETVRNVRNALLGLLLCMLTFLFQSEVIVRGNEPNSSVKPLAKRYKAIFWVLGTIGSTAGLGWILWLFIKMTPFAMSIEQGTAITLPFALPDRSVVENPNYIQTIAAPNPNDVLLSSRLNHDKLYQQCRWLDYHGPNRRYLNLIFAYKEAWMAYRGMSPGFRKSFLEFVSSESLREESSRMIHRLLRQNSLGDWMQLSTDEEIDHANHVLTQLWSLPYSKSKHVSAFWTGACACRESQPICAFSRVSSIPAPTLSSKKQELVPWAQKLVITSSLRPLRQALQTTGSNSSFEVGDKVEAHISYFKTRRWFSATIESIKESSGIATVHYDIPINNERHPLTKIRRTLQLKRAAVIHIPLKSRRAI